MEESSVEMKNAKPKTSICIPTEVNEIILSKLPVQSLKRSLPVDKEWYNSITKSRQLLSSHLRFTNSLNHNTLFFLDFNIRRESSYVLYSDDDDEAFNIHAILKAPVKGSTNDLHVLGSCNGLICLSDCKQLVVLWNPIIKKCVHLPESRNDSRDVTRFAFGCVFDHVKSEFKVLRTTHPWDGELVVEIFRLGTDDLWERWSEEIPFDHMYGYQVVLKGFAHWIGMDNDGKLAIISFDVCKEVFGLIAPPMSLTENYDTEYWTDYPVFLFLFEESLVLVHFATEYENDDLNNGESRTRYDFWKMEEYGKGESWNLWHSIYCYANMSPLGFRKNGQFLWDDVESREFISINLENFTETCLGRYEASSINKCLNYVETLALIDTTPTNRLDVGVEIGKESQPPSL